VVAAAGGLIAVTLVDAASFLIGAALIAALRTSGGVEIPGSGPALMPASNRPRRQRADSPCSATNGSTDCGWWPTTGCYAYWRSSCW
jgi:hypothetical protein